MQRADDEAARAELDLKQRMLFQPSLGADGGAVAGNELGAFGGAIGRTADLAQHGAAAGVVDAVFLLDRLPQLGTGFSQAGYIGDKFVKGKS